MYNIYIYVFEMNKELWYIKGRQVEILKNYEKQLQYVIFGFFYYKKNKIKVVCKTIFEIFLV